VVPPSAACHLEQSLPSQCNISLLAPPDQEKYIGFRATSPSPLPTCNKYDRQCLIPSGAQQLGSYLPINNKTYRCGPHELSGPLLIYQVIQTSNRKETTHHNLLKRALDLEAPSHHTPHFLASGNITCLSRCEQGRLNTSSSCITHHLTPLYVLYHHSNPSSFTWSPSSPILLSPQSHHLHIFSFLSPSLFCYFQYQIVQADFIHTVV